MGRSKADKEENKGKRHYVLLHGFCLDHHIWNECRTVLGDRLSLHTPDLPGFGTSPALHEVLTMEALSTWLHRWLAQQQLGPFVLLGHSLGGYIALEYAHKYGDELLGLGLIHSHAYADSEQKKADRLRVERFVAGHGSIPYLKESIPGLFSEEFRVRKAGEVARLIKENRHIDPDVIIRYLKAMRLRSKREKLLQELDIPALFVMGTEDALIPLNDNIRQAVYPAISSVKIIEGAGHMSMLEDPEQVAEALLQFDFLLDHISD